ncbi:MAG TPA: hypothetical protein VNU70_03070 [Puia sp.]|jgi:hypothetical protein|nr:hypothetical protein [Puia sp.]
MKRTIEISFLLVGGVTVATAVYLCCHVGGDLTKILKILGAAAAVLFFAYKLLTGWLFINLNVSIEPDRKPAGGDRDHLALKVMLSKGSIDSLWVRDIECRVSAMVPGEAGFTPERITTVKPQGMKKAKKLNSQDYWSGETAPYYVLSPKEEATFTAYTTVGAQQVILVEVIIVGTRPFYGIEFKNGKPIQWRSSIVSLPGG